MEAERRAAMHRPRKEAERRAAIVRPRACRPNCISRACVLGVVPVVVRIVLVVLCFVRVGAIRNYFGPPRFRTLYLIRN